MATTKTRSKSNRSTSSSSSRRRTSSNGGSTSAAGAGARTAGDTADAAAERIRDLNERIIESSKKAGNVYLDIYEKTLNSIADYQEKVGEKSQVDWVSTIANAQASFTRDLAGAYSAAARSLLK
jgi:hypothetical protein